MLKYEVVTVKRNGDSWKEQFDREIDAQDARRLIEQSRDNAAVVIKYIATDKAQLQLHEGFAREAN